MYYFDSFASAFNNINSLADPALDYVFTVRKEGYELTKSDGYLIAGFTGTLKSLKITSHFTLTEGNIKERSEQAGQTVMRQVNFASDVAPTLLLAPGAAFTDGVTIDAIKFGGTSTRLTIYACGHKLTTGESVLFNTDASRFPILFGGSATTALPNKDAHLIINGGTYAAVYGGGAAEAAAVRSTKVPCGRLGDRQNHDKRHHE